MKTTILFAFAAMLCIAKAQAQQKDSLDTGYTEWLAKDLNISYNKAKQVASAILEYKSKAKAVATNKQLKPEEKNAKFNALITEKNDKLAKLLNQQQLQKVVPATEKRTPTSKNN